MYWENYTDSQILDLIFKELELDDLDNIQSLFNKIKQLKEGNT